MNTNNPTFGIWVNLKDERKTRSNISHLPYLSKGEGVWCPMCKKNGVNNWLDFERKTSNVEIYEICKVHGRIKL